MMNTEKDRFVVWQKDLKAYVKLGGGFTQDLSEAQIIGWKSAFDKRGRWASYPKTYELRKVKIVLDCDNPSRL